MDRSLRWRSIGLVAIVAFCVLSLLPSFVGKSALPSWYTKIFDRRMQLGLDLQGGLRIVYSIDLDKAVDDKSSEIKRDVEAYLHDEKIEGTASTPSQLGAVTVRVGDAEKRDATKKWLLSQYSGVLVERPCPTQTDHSDAICVRVSSEYSDSIKKSALEQAVETIRSRIDEKGIAEPTVVTKGDDIIVELPGLDQDNIDRMLDIIARTAKLEFKKVLEDEEFMRGLFKHVRQDTVAATKGILAETDGWRHDDSGKYYTDYYL